MLNSVRSLPLPILGAVTGALLILVPASAAPAGPFSDLCSANKPAVLARVSGFKAPRGTVIVKLYASNPKTFLEKGSFLRKVDVPVHSAGPIDICVPVPQSGKYALSVRHEINGDKSRADGGGFSGNPHVSLMDVIFQRKPSIDKVSFSVDGATRVIPVTLNYIQGGSVRPVSG
jgi:uncharacterized protein (DUF2141 family)